MKKYTEIENQYKQQQTEWKNKIKQEPSKLKRFFKWLWFFIAFPFVWLFVNIRDLKTAIIFLIVLAVYSGSVWGFYLASLLCGWTSTDVGKWLFGIGTTIWAWWLSPAGSPFILLCIVTTIGVKALFNKISHRKHKKGQNSEVN